MAFYSQIVEAYNELFPFNKKQLEFVEQKLGNSLAGKCIMDIGCGTGALSVAMARRSARVRAFDYDESMIKKAKENQPQALDLSFQQGDMRLTKKLYSSVSFDSVLCFGNTLVHLQNESEVFAVFNNVASQLKEGGKFLFQIINYDRILKDRVDALPTINTDNYTFVRNYIHRHDGNIDFNTILTTSNERIENTVTLLALTKKQVVDELKNCFPEVNVFGGFDGGDWTPQSFHLVVEAIK